MIILYVYMYKPFDYNYKKCVKWDNDINMYKRQFRFSYDDMLK